MQTKCIPWLLLSLAMGYQVRAQDGFASYTTATYDSLRTLLAAGETDIDYTMLRLAYVATEHYAPYAVEPRRQRNRMLQALYRDSDLTRATEVADSFLVHRYVDPEAHYVKLVIAETRGDALAAGFHDRVLSGLLGSIFAGRNGRDETSALLVLSTDEEYALLRMMGLQVQAQDVVECAGFSCDLLEVSDVETGERYALYFDIRYPMRHLSSSLSPNE